MTSPKKGKSELLVFEVEHVLGKRIANDKIEYLIKWKNWPNSKNSWQTKENLSTQCQLVVGLFDRMSASIPRDVSMNYALTHGSQAELEAPVLLPMTTHIEVVPPSPASSTATITQDDESDGNATDIAADENEQNELAEVTNDDKQEKNFDPEFLEFEEVLDFEWVDGKLFFLLKWKNYEDMHWTTAKFAEKQFPHGVINFLESNVKFRRSRAMLRTKYD